MPPLLGETASSSVAKPILEIFTPTGGILTDPTILEFQIFRAESDDDFLTPVQVFPASGRQAVDLVNDKISTGHFAAVVSGSSFTGTTVAGRHLIRWFYKFSPTDPEQAVEHEFEVILAKPISFLNLSYCMLRDLREHGFAVADISDARAIRVLLRMATFIEDTTGQAFFPQLDIRRRDGNNARELLLDDVLIAVEKLEIVNQTLVGASSGLIDLADLFLYSRHLTERMRAPDDRANPKLSFIRRTDLGGLHDPSQADLLFRNRLIFPVGAKNVIITGLWGYTDADPAHTDDKVGITPFGVQDLCLRLFQREFPLMTDDARAAARTGPIKAERTRQQSVTYGTTGLDGASGGITGDVEIDRLLAQFARPLAIDSG